MNTKDNGITGLIESSLLDESDDRSLFDAACYLIGQGRYDDALDKLAKIHAEKHSVQVSFLEYLIYFIQGDKTKALEKVKDNFEVNNPYSFLFYKDSFSEKHWRQIVNILKEHKTNLVSFFVNLKVNPPKDASDFDRSKLIELAERENKCLIEQNNKVLEQLRLEEEHRLLFEQTQQACMSTAKSYKRVFSFIDMVIIGTIGCCVFDWIAIGGDTAYHIIVLLGCLCVWFLRTFFLLSDDQIELIKKNEDFILGRQFFSFFYVSATSALVYFFFPLLFMIFWDRSEPLSLFGFTIGGVIIVLSMIMLRGCDSIINKIKNNEVIKKDKLENTNSTHGIKGYHTSLSRMIVVDVIMLCVNIYIAINYL